MTMNRNYYCSPNNLSMIKLNDNYEQLPFLELLQDFLPDFEKDIRKIDVSEFKVFDSGYSLGKSKKLDLQVFEVKHKSSNTARVAIATDGFRLMKQSAVYRALVVFRTESSDDWRLSLMTLNPERNENGGVSVQVSNPRRYSYLLGNKAKINTPTKFLVSKGKISDFEDLKSRFSIEVVNKEFYKEISGAFSKLVGGELKLPSTEEKSRTNLEFAVRMIGRIIFCWFLREKISEAKVSLMPKELLSLEAIANNEDYYHKVLEPIFFEILNKPARSRRQEFSDSPYSSIPYLNGGLFSSQDDDFYKRTNGDMQSQYHNTLIIPDSWFKDFFKILETYNFTIDENTSYDEELSIDPEMLGRIFENLLAEINPETGESARKSTGSYYTPRVIVNYMVDESLLLYLKSQTEIGEDKLRAVISYDLGDDLAMPLDHSEREKIIDALEKVKILDPACGSGAFPMGALQKIVFILQQTDPDGQLWFKKQIKNTSPEIKRIFERELAHKNFDYIRKLGIIRENIYGVDIQPVATEISRLRCFLTIVVDERIQDDAENRGIEPLPNLDFKFVTANSLIGLPNTVDNPIQVDLFDNMEKIEELKEIRDQYFNSYGIEREQLKAEFAKAQKDLVYQLVQEHGAMSLFKSELTQKLTEWDPFVHKSTPWFDPEWMFGIKEGFDIVIANPPYVSYYSKQSQTNRRELEILKSLISSYQFIKNKKRLGRFNTLMFFIERGLRLLRVDGVLNYIVDTNIHSNPAQDIREYIMSKSQLLQITDNLSEFENVASSQAILLVQNTTLKEPYEVAWKKYSNGNFTVDKIDSFSKINSSNDYSFKLPNEDNKVNLLVKIDSNLKLSELLGNKNVRTCITFTGKKDAFIHNKKTEEADYPLLEGSHSLPFPYAKVTYQTYVRYDTALRDVLNEAYRKKAISEGKRSPMVIGLGDIKRFQAPKLFIRLSDKRLTATYSEDRVCADLSLYIITLPNLSNEWKEYSLKYLLGVINSRLLTFYFVQKNYIRNLKTGTPQIRLKEIRKIPLPGMIQETSGYQKSIESLVERILNLTSTDDYLQNNTKQSQVEEYEKQIDQIVYDLYGLTKDEIEVVENAN